ncbi:MAG: TIGR03618 family F420-dependent PPOX class oxidoreductase [Solirubrobacterales bacterium]
MPEPPLSPQAQEILAKPNPAVLATVRPDGAPHTAATWFDWDGERILLNMDRNRRRLRYIEANPAASLTVLDDEDWLRQVTLLGPIALVDDDGLRDVDRLARRYISAAYPIRDRPRVSGWLRPTSWYLWDARGRGEDPLAIRPRR